MEGPRKPSSSLEEALARLEKSVKEKERNTRRFETEGGFSASVQFFDGGFVNLTLQKAGLHSVFEVSDSGVRFNELRGPDGELLDEPRLRDQHIAEAQALFDAGKLERYDSDGDQYRLDL